MSYHNTSVSNAKDIYWKDFDLTFSKNTEHNGLNTVGDINILYGKSAVAQSMENIILTYQSERVFDMTFGTSISSLLFENSESKLYLEGVVAHIMDIVAARDSRIDVLNMDLETSEQVNGGFELTIQYQTLTSNSNEVLSTTISLYRVR